MPPQSWAPFQILRLDFHSSCTMKATHEAGLAGLARPARAPFAAADRHPGTAAVAARQGALRRAGDHSRRTADQRHDPPRRILGAGVSRPDPGGDAVSPHDPLRQPARCAAHARRRRFLLHRRASHAVFRRPKLRSWQGRARDHATAGISSLAAPLGSAWRCWPRPRPTAWCAGSAACAGAGCIRRFTASRCWP